MKNPVRDVIDRYVGHEYPAEIDGKFRSWLTDEDHAEEKEAGLKSLWDETESATVPAFDESMDRMRRLTGIADRRQLRRLRVRLRVWRAAAAVVVLAVASAALLLPVRTVDGLQPDLLQAYIPKAEMQTLTLPDGTVAMLNANSTLLYPQEFTGSERCVYLTGEADFKVKPDAEHPFIVKSSDLQVTALGTEFNVAAYPDEDEITTTLLSGKVKVDFDNLSRSETLMPNSQLVYSRSSRKAEKRSADLSDVTAWQRGEIVMRGMTPDEIFNRLARKFPYTFIYSPHSLKSDRYTLTFDSDASLNEVMTIITKVMGDISYRIEADRCYVESKGNS